MRPKGRATVKFFPLVLDSNLTLTNQQFVNCAYLKIRHHASAPAPTLCTSSVLRCTR